ncbi:hypothetical protein Calag_0333 [Caldisphaera lagunensis DSM 15908]|uniref:Uncharacterized protein n=1 Tax=Caldisphaera lagunensis (strain DSM 15908 / JCM 11604 / ANMR 0165 / IC-154) TaxID=1056495 RepID=L0AAR4_CALLD|nr:hypothetical protein [Caldisphaera lagunensis]AFZ70110.1 hypothetical protein Calag_0333 [Caldisphaera lagunensis DSM 15908]
MRLTKLLNYKGFKLILSVILGLITFAVGISLAIALKRPLYLSIIPALMVGILTYVSSDAASKELMNYVNNLYQKVNELSDDMDFDTTQNEEETVSNDEEDLFIVYNLIKGIVKQISKEAKDIIIEIYKGDFALVYPEVSLFDDETDIDNEISYDYPEDGSDAKYHNGKLIIRMRYEDFYNLLSSLKKGDGEVAVFSTINELRTLYNITKIITIALLDEDSNELTSYITYKAIMSLKEKGILNIYDNIIEELPFESKDLKKKIKEQVKEESGTLY